MTFTETNLSGSYVIELTPHADNRGWFARTFCKAKFREIGHQKEWVQLNHSVTYKEGSIRGMHFQWPPYTEIKLVRCIAGRIYDVIIDLRQNSPTFLNWYGVELSAENKKMLYIPEGFAHGFQTLTDNCELIYHHSTFYTPGYEGGIRYNDKTFNILWKTEVTEVSDRDNNHPILDKTFPGIKV